MARPFLALAKGRVLLGAWGINIDKMLPLGGNPQVLHKGEHVLAHVLVVLVDWGTVPWLVAYRGFADASKDRAEEFSRMITSAAIVGTACWGSEYRRDWGTLRSRSLPRSFLIS